MSVKSEVPKALQVHFQRIFGSTADAKRETRTDAQWRRILDRSLDEIFQYIERNVHTDRLHTLMLMGALSSAHESLQKDNFWPGYTEGIMRIALLLMGDYPDHRRRARGKKKTDHYDLTRMRTLGYTQTPEQSLATLFAAQSVGHSLSGNPRQALRQFRAEEGYSSSYKDFLRWYKAKYPTDYAEVF